MSVLLDIDPLTGAIETMDYDHVTKGLTITRTTNVDAILDRNVVSFNDGGQAWRGTDNDMWHVASVPLDVLYVWLQEFNQGKTVDACLQSPFASDPAWDRFIYGRLNSNEFRKLRTAPVTI